MLKILYSVSPLHSLPPPGNAHFTSLSDFYSPPSYCLLVPQLTSWPCGVVVTIGDSACNRAAAPYVTIIIVVKIPHPLSAPRPPSPRSFIPRCAHRTQSKMPTNFLRPYLLPRCYVTHPVIPGFVFPKCYPCNWIYIMKHAFAKIQQTSVYKPEPDDPHLPLAVNY